MERGDNVAILRDGKAVRVGKVTRTAIKQFTVGREGNFLLSSMRKVGSPDVTCRAVSQAEANQITAEIEAERERESEARFQAEQAERQAEYDALPESAKLAGKLKWMCECNSEKKISAAPIELLRGIVEWATSAGLELE